MLKFRHLGSKTNVKFEISTFEIGYMRNFVKIRKLIFFGPKCPNLGIWARNLKKINDKFEISSFKIGYMQNFVKIRKSILFSPKCPIVGNPKFPQFEILGRFGSFRKFLGVVLAGFGSFWLVPGFSKYDYCVCLLTFAIIIFSKAYGMSYATRVAISNLRNNFCENLF